MGEVVPLFPEPSRSDIRLSEHFKGNWYQRAIPGAHVSYKAKTYKAFRPCEECSYLQHETRGLFHPRRAVKMRRTVKGSRKVHDAHIELCSEHAQLWRELDRQDEHG